MNNIIIFPFDNIYNPEFQSKGLLPKCIFGRNLFIWMSLNSNGLDRASIQMRAYVCTESIRAVLEGDGDGDDSNTLNHDMNIECYNLQSTCRYIMSFNHSAQY